MFGWTPQNGAEPEVLNMFDKATVIQGKRVYLRILTEADVTEKYCSWINDPDINKYLAVRRTTFEEQRKYVREKYNSDNCLFFGIFLLNSNTHIGNVKFEPIDIAGKKSDISLLIGERGFWGKGFGKEAYNVLIHYLFKNGILDSISTGCYKKNLGAFKVAKSIGFKISSENEISYKMLLEKADFRFLKKFVS